MLRYSSWRDSRISNCDWESLLSQISALPIRNNPFSFKVCCQWAAWNASGMSYSSAPPVLEHRVMQMRKTWEPISLWVYLFFQDSSRTALDRRTKIFLGLVNWLWDVIFIVYRPKDPALMVSNSGSIVAEIPFHRAVLPQLSLHSLDLSPLNSHSSGSVENKSLTKAELLPFGSSTMADRAPQRSETNESAKELNC